jgi:hypothetical protein
MPAIFNGSTNQIRSKIIMVSSGISVLTTSTTKSSIPQHYLFFEQQHCLVENEMKNFGNVAPK